MKPSHCVGTHLLPPRPGWEKIRWRAARVRTDHVRVREHTCDCVDVVYELISSGGLRHVRRTRFTRYDEIVVQESPWLPAKQGDELWLQLLMGLAR